MADNGRRLIEEWLPIAALGEESVRERRSMTALPPTYYLHVWWARRPLVASRAAILASLLPADADREKFIHVLGIHGDPVTAKQRMDEASANIDPNTGKRVNLGPNPYGYRRAFTYSPTTEERKWLAQTAGADFSHPLVCLDPTAGGGSIPFEASRLGLGVVANDLNPVAWMILKATVDFPSRFGDALLKRYKQLAERFQEIATTKCESANVFAREPEGTTVEAFLWAKTVECPYCGGKIPLSPHWRLTSGGMGVRVLPDASSGECSFEIVDDNRQQSPGTAKGGDAWCPFPGCGRVVDGAHVKKQAQAGELGQQLYAVVYKEDVVVGATKAGKTKKKSVRRFRTAVPSDDVAASVAEALASKMPEWEARNIVPSEEYPSGTNDDRPIQYGMPLWRDMFSPRQLLVHCVSVESFLDLVDAVRHESGGEESDLDRAALTYVALAIDKLVDYNSQATVWITQRSVIGHTFSRHDFAFRWAYAEFAPAVVGKGYEWALKQTGKALRELLELSRGNGEKDSLFSEEGSTGAKNVLCGSGDALDLADESVDCVVMDPPYYDNVMYAELSDFFYVWLKRTAGVLFPAEFAMYLTDKDREAVASPAKFKGQLGGAKKLAGRDYQHRMQALFGECRRVLRRDGVLTVMFTHKASGAWDALAAGLVSAGFVVTASWPVNTEAGGLHIAGKAAAKSTVFLVCRPQEQPAEDEVKYWEEVEPQVAAVVRKRVQEFQDAGIGGVDLYLACFGPALQVFSENWPLKRGRPIQQPKGLKLAKGEEWDPYAVRPEDALDAARREVKQWRLAKLAAMQRQHHLDPLTEWYVLAWDAFKAPRFPADEALKLARVVGLDFDKEVKNIACEVKSSDVILWDSKVRKSKGKLGPVGEDVMLDTLHHAALAGRDQNTGAAKAIVENAGLLEDPTLLVALEAMLNVLPPPGTASAGSKKDASVSGAANDCDALEKLRRLAFAEEIPEVFSQKSLFADMEN